MLPKANRLHKDKDIKGLVRAGKSFFLPQFVIKYRKSDEENSRVAFVVSTKVDKKAVVRNKLARRMREVLRELLPELKGGYYLLIIAKKSALELDYQEIRSQLVFALTKAKLYSK